MFKRAFFAMLGLGAGVTIGVWAMRRLDEAQRKLTPEELARSAQGRATAVGSRLSEAYAVGREAAAERESELRAVYRSTEDR
ncbi:MAG: hypothetical protein R6T85_02085 [Egibacteraceae bacterium]